MSVNSTFLRLTPLTHLHFKNVDKDSLTFMKESFAENAANGNIEGIGWNPHDDGLSHRNQSIKDRRYLEENGTYPECRTLAIW